MLQINDAEIFMIIRRLVEEGAGGKHPSLAMPHNNTNKNGTFHVNAKALQCTETSLKNYQYSSRPKSEGVRCQDLGLCDNMAYNNVNNNNNNTLYHSDIVSAPCISGDHDDHTCSSGVTDNNNVNIYKISSHKIIRKRIYEEEEEDRELYSHVNDDCSSSNYNKVTRNCPSSSSSYSSSHVYSGATNINNLLCTLWKVCIVLIITQSLFVHAAVSSNFITSELRPKLVIRSGKLLYYKHRPSYYL